MATTERPTNLERIIRDVDTLAGKPVVRGTRIPVELVLAKLARNPDLEELSADYPRLTVDDITACLEYGQVLVGREPKARRRKDSPEPPTL